MSLFRHIRCNTSLFFVPAPSIPPAGARWFHPTTPASKGAVQATFDQRNRRIELDADEIEFVGRKLRGFQRAATGVEDPLPSTIEPSPLHLVTMTRSFGRNPWWLKKILWEFGLFASPRRKFPFHNKAVVPNTPENNEKLAKIKHVVRIDRVTFPFGYPETEEDLRHARISDYGEVTFVKTIEAEDVAAAETPLPRGTPRTTPPEEMDEETIKIDCRRKLVNHEFLTEYHPEYENREFGQQHFKGLKVYWDENKPPVVY